MPGGTKFMRNPPPPLEAVFPDGVPEDVAHHVQPVHADKVPLQFRPDGDKRLVDFGRKRFY